jgi:hypothetical protein
MGNKHEKWRIGSLICTTPERLRYITEVFYEPHGETMMVLADPPDASSLAYVNFEERSENGQPGDSCHLARGVSREECEAFLAFAGSVTERTLVPSDISGNIKAWVKSPDPYVHGGKTPSPVVIYER